MMNNKMHGLEDKSQLEMYTKAKKSALGLLAMREHSAQELKCKLAERGFDTNTIAQILVDIGKSGLQSDERFAEFYVKSRIDRGYGPLRIEAELRERGIAQSLIREFLDKNSEIWRTSAEKVYQKKFGKLPLTAANQDEKLKRLHFLQYRGFGMEQLKGIKELGK